MVFPYARHIQRYEYPVAAGYVKDSIVADIGCGATLEPLFLSSCAKVVYAIDTKHIARNLHVHAPADCNMSRIVEVSNSIFNFHKQCDVSIAIEVFEHIKNPNKFIEHIASISKHLFITTPLAEVTGKTRNLDHVKEYSNKSFRHYVEKHFDILDQKFQLGDLSILDEAKPNGDSFNVEHVVQMLWCRRRNG